MEQFAITLSYISILSVLVPLLAYLRYPIAHKVAQTLAVLLVAGLVSDIANELYTRSGGRDFYLLNAFNLIQFCLLSRIYYECAKKKDLIKLGVLLFFILWIINSIFFQHPGDYQSQSRLVGSCILIIFSIRSYIQLSNSASPDRRLNMLLLWINTGVLFYFFLNLYLISISDYVMKQMFKEDAMIIWGFHSVSNVIKNFLFAFALYEAGRKETDMVI